MDETTEHGTTLSRHFFNSLVFSICTDQQMQKLWQFQGTKLNAPITCVDTAALLLRVLYFFEHFLNKAYS